MAFKERDKDEAKSKDQSGNGSKRREDVRQGEGIRINNSGYKNAVEDISEKADEKKFFVEDNNIKEYIRQAKGVLEMTAAAAAVCGRRYNED